VVGAALPAGSTERELLRAGVRYSLGLRVVIVLVTSVLSLVVEDAPEPGVTAALVVVLGGWTGWYAYRFRRRGRWLVPMDVAVLCVMCVTQVWTVPAAASAPGVTWVIGVAGITVITYAWQLGVAGHVVATLVVMAACLAGAAIANLPGWLDIVPVQLWMVIEAGLSRALYVLVRKGARTADRAVARGEQARRDAAVAEARRADEREYLAALHDTASATLLMIGSGVADRPSTWLSAQAARDLAAIGGEAGTPGSEPIRHEVDLAEHLRDIAEHLPLTVRWDVQEPVIVAAVDAAALAGGVREALTNVMRHAGVDEATISLRGLGNRIVVEVVDGGVGFDPALVRADRYGVTRSIVERMTRAGGRAEVVSSPGNGTRVRLERALDAPEPAGGDVETISAGVGNGLRWSVVVMNLIILYGLDLPRLLANQRNYAPAWPQFLALAVLTGITAVVAAHLWRRRPLGLLTRWLLVVAVFAVSVPATASVPPDLRLGIAHWSEGDAAWTLVLLVMDSRFVVLVTVLALHYAMTYLQTALGGAADLTFGAALNAAMVVLGYQLAVGMVAAVLRPVAVTAAATAYREGRLRTARAVAEQIHRDRTARYAALADTTAPLLARLASGAADPADPAFRRACAMEAARVRRLLAEDASVPDPLSHELRACVELAERNGITVQFAERGTRTGDMPTAVRRALADPVLAALATAASTARVTVVGDGAAVTVSVVTDGVCEPVLTTLSPEVEVSTMANDDRTWVKSTWRTT
jgi:signal transduction histidine kinase